MNSTMLSDIGTLKTTDRGKFIASINSINDDPMCSYMSDDDSDEKSEFICVMDSKGLCYKVMHINGLKTDLQSKNKMSPYFNTDDNETKRELVHRREIFIFILEKAFRLIMQFMNGVQPVYKTDEACLMLIDSLCADLNNDPYYIQMIKEPIKNRSNTFDVGYEIVVDDFVNANLSDQTRFDKNEDDFKTFWGNAIDLLSEMLCKSVVTTTSYKDLNMSKTNILSFRLSNISKGCITF